MQNGLFKRVKLIYIKPDCLLAAAFQSFLTKYWKFKACFFSLGFGNRASRATVGASISKFTQQAGGRVHWVLCGRRAGWRIHSCSLLSVAPSCPLRSPPIICPDGRARGPNEPFGTERKEGASCSCDVGVVPFTAFAMATGQRPWKHAGSPSLWTASWGQRLRQLEVSVPSVWNISNMLLQNAGKLDSVHEVSKLPNMNVWQFGGFGY